MFIFHWMLFVHSWPSVQLKSLDRRIQRTASQKLFVFIAFYVKTNAQVTTLLVRWAMTHVVPL